MRPAGIDNHVFIPELQLHAHASRASLSNSITRKRLAGGAMMFTGFWAMTTSRRFGARTGGDLGTRICSPSAQLFAVDRDPASGVFVPPSPLLPGQVTAVSASWLRKRKPGPHGQLFWDEVGTEVSEIG